MKLAHFRCSTFILLIMLPILAAAQSSSTRPPKIGLLSWGPCETAGPGHKAFMRGLGELGYELGTNITIECRSAGRHDDGLAPAAAELVKLGVDVIVTHAQPGGMAAQKVTDTIPIVSIISGDPVRAGMARSLAEPGGNVTGVSYYASELTGKRLDLLKRAVPKLARVGVLANPVVSYLPFEADTKRAAAQLGLEVGFHHVSEPVDLAGAFAAMKAQRAQAVFVLPDMMLASEAKQIGELALEHQLPTMTWGSWYPKLGCLMAYSAEYLDMHHRLAYYVDRVLKGAKPGELPIEQPLNFYLSINLKTANALGLELPQALLLSARDLVE